MTIHLVTVATHSERYFPYLKQTAKDKGWNLTVLGWGQKWTGFAMKIRLLQDHLKTLDKDDIMVSVDGFDTFVMADKDEVLKKFTESGKDILYSVDHHYTYPRLEMYIMKRIFREIEDSNLNSGCFIGKCGSLLELFNNCCGASFEMCEDSMDDQRIITTNVSRDNLDLYDNIFLNMFTS